MQQRPDAKGVYPSTTLIAVAVSLLFVFITVAYFYLLAEPDERAEEFANLEELHEQRALWQREQPASFRYVVERSCRCPAEVSEPYVATESRGARSASFRIAVESSDGSMLDKPPEPVWIIDVFRALERSLQSGGTAEVSYDPTWGYPDSARIGGDQPGSTDLFRIVDFEVLEYD